MFTTALCPPFHPPPCSSPTTNTTTITPSTSSSDLKPFPCCVSLFPYQFVFPFNLKPAFTPTPTSRLLRCLTSTKLYPNPNQLFSHCVHLCNSLRKVKLKAPSGVFLFTVPLRPTCLQYICLFIKHLQRQFAKYFTVYVHVCPLLQSSLSTSLLVHCHVSLLITT